MSLSDDARISLAQAHERIGAIDKTATAAHQRVDKLEFMLRDDFREIKKDLGNLAAELKHISQQMHQRKGWADGVIWMMGIFGTALGFLISAAIRHFL